MIILKIILFFIFTSQLTGFHTNKVKKTHPKQFEKKNHLESHSVTQG